MTSQCGTNDPPDRRSVVLRADGATKPANPARRPSVAEPDEEAVSPDHDAQPGPRAAERLAGQPYAEALVLTHAGAAMFLPEREDVLERAARRCDEYLAAVESRRSVQDRLSDIAFMRRFVQAELRPLPTVSR